MTSQKEVKVLSPGVEGGVITISLKHAVQNPVAKFAFDQQFRMTPTVNIQVEGGKKTAVKCSVGMLANGNFNIHLYAAKHGDPVPEGTYVLRYRAEAASEPSTLKST